MRLLIAGLGYKNVYVMGAA